MTTTAAPAAQSTTAAVPIPKPQPAPVPNPPPTVSAVAPAPPPAVLAAASASSPVQPPQLVLPDGCSTISAAAQQVVICQPAHETAWAKMLPTVPALAVSVLALAVSLGTLFYNRKKDTRARRQSIVDDFWLRKVIAPVSIEPFLKATTELCTTLPDSKWASNGVQTFWKDQAEESAKLAVAFLAFNLIDQPLCGTLTTKLEEIDDVVAEYCGLLQQSLENNGVPPPPDRNVAIEAIQAVCMKVYDAVKAHQEKVN